MTDTLELTAPPALAPTPLFRVVIRGIREGYTREQAVALLAPKIKLSETQAQAMLERPKVIAKRGLDEEMAKKYQKVLERCGCICTVEADSKKPQAAVVAPAPVPVPDSPVASVAASVVDALPEPTVVPEPVAAAPEPVAEHVAEAVAMLIETPVAEPAPAPVEAHVAEPVAAMAEALPEAVTVAEAAATPVNANAPEPVAAMEEASPEAVAETVAPPPAAAPQPAPLDELADAERFMRSIALENEPAAPPAPAINAFVFREDTAELVQAPPLAPKAKPDSRFASMELQRFFSPGFGIELQAPMSWKEIRDDKFFQVIDPDTDTQFTASAFARTGISVQEWADMRLSIVNQQMRYLTQVEPPLPFIGKGWGERIEAVVAEYTGTFPGKDYESHYIACCMRSEQFLISFTVTAKASVFREQEDLYRWLLANAVDVIAIERDETAANAEPAPIDDAVAEEIRIDQVKGGQKMLIYTVLLNLVFGGSFKSLGMGPAIVFAVILLGMSLVAMMRVASGLEWSNQKKIGLAVASFIPGVNLIALLFLNMKAIRFLKDAGFEVGLLGVKSGGSNFYG